MENIITLMIITTNFSSHAMVSSDSVWNRKLLCPSINNGINIILRYVIYGVNNTTMSFTMWGIPLIIKGFNFIIKSGNINSKLKFQYVFWCSSDTRIAY